MIRPTITCCPRCQGPVTTVMARCPHCETALGASPNPVVRVGTGILATISGVSVSMTLAACYGAPCAMSASGECWGVSDIPSCSEITADPEEFDLDGDGYCLDYDCDEEDDSIHAAATDYPDDGIDSDCDGRDDPAR